MSGGSGERPMSAISKAWCRGYGQPDGKRCMRSSARLRRPRPFDGMTGNEGWRGPPTPRRVGNGAGMVALSGWVLNSSKAGDVASSLPHSFPPCWLCVQSQSYQWLSQPHCSQLAWFSTYQFVTQELSAHHCSIATRVLSAVPRTAKRLRPL